MTFDQALDRNAKTYEGRPCRRGHTRRWVSNDNCVDCNATYVRTAASKARQVVRQRERRAERKS